MKTIEAPHKTKSSRGTTSVVRQLTDPEALDRIRDALDGVEWTPDTLDDITELVRKTGRPIQDLDRS